MKRYKVNLIAGVQVNLAAVGDFVRVITGVGEFNVKTDTAATLSGFQSGMAYTSPRAFKGLELISDTTQNIELMIGFGTVEDNRSSINGVVDTAGRGGSVITDAHTVGTAEAVLVAANSNRRSIIILNNDAANTVYIGGNSLAGFPIKAGQSLTLDHSAGSEITAAGDVDSMSVKTIAELD